MPTTNDHSPCPKRRALARGEPLWLLLAALLGYALAFGVRAAEAPRWSEPELRIGAERVMATPDAYHWLAGARGLGRAIDQAPARFAALAADFFGVGLDNVGFWAPALLSSLAAPAALLWAWTLLRAWPASVRFAAGLAAGTLTALVPAYYSRTRLGYYDTDMLLLPIPLLVSWALAQALLPPSAPDNSSDPAPAPLLPFALALGAGLLAHFSASWHAQLAAYNLALGLLALLLAPFLAPSGRRLWALLTALAYCACVLLGWIGLLAILLAAFGTRIGRALALLARPVGRGGALLAVLLGLGFFAFAAIPNTERIAREFDRLQRRALTTRSIPWVDPSLAGRPGAMRYPEMTESIEEAQPIAGAELLTLLHPWAGVALSGLAGFLLLLWRRPEALLLAPLLALGLAAYWLGQRTLMFAAPVMALGLCLPAVEFLDKGLRELCPAPKRRATLVAGLLLAGAAVLFAPLLRSARLAPLTPALSRAQGQALLALRAIAPPGSRVWTWWDFGYAALYYSGLTPISDGGRQGPEYVYMVGKVLSAESPLQAQQLIRYVPFHKYTPWEPWNRGSAQEHAELHDAFKESERMPPAEDKQYLVLAAEALPLAPRIFEYGSWDPRSGESRPPYCVSLLGTPEILGDSGVLSNARQVVPRADRASVELDGLYRASRGRQESYAFPERSGLYLLELPEAQVRLLMDARAWRSLLAQSLQPEAPARLAPWFKLVYEDAPYARVYETR